jgi:ParB family chromosome partitioning protein
MVTALARTAAKTEQKHKFGKLEELPVASIDLSPDDLRDDCPQEEIQRLADTLETTGLIQAVLARPLAGGRYEVVCGGRRLRAAKLAGWKTIPAIVRPMEDGQAKQAMLVENLERSELNPMEIARGLQHLIRHLESAGEDTRHGEVAARFGHKQSWTSNHLGLLKLPDVWQRRIASGEVRLTEARELLPLIEQPSMLAAVDSDFRNNPGLYVGFKSFQRSVRQVVAQHPAVTQPRRRFRDPIVEEPAKGARTQTAAGNGRQSPIEHASKLNGDSAQAAQVETAPSAAPGRSMPAGLDTGEIVALMCRRIEQFQSTAHLDTLQKAIDRRRKELKEES